MTPPPEAPAINHRGELDPRFCITCGALLDHRLQDWFWNGDHPPHGPEHFACRKDKRDD